MTTSSRNEAPNEAKPKKKKYTYPSKKKVVRYEAGASEQQPERVPIVPVNPRSVKELSAEQKKIVREILGIYGCRTSIRARISKQYGYPRRLVDAEYKLWLFEEPTID